MNLLPRLNAVVDNLLDLIEARDDSFLQLLTASRVVGKVDRCVSVQAKLRDFTTRLLRDKTSTTVILLVRRRRLRSRQPRTSSSIATVPERHIVDRGESEAGERFFEERLGWLVGASEWTLVGGPDAGRLAEGSFGEV